MLPRTTLLVLSWLASHATAHTYIWGVFINGVDQGLFNGIRTPPYNAAPGAGGYANSPVKDLDSLDLRCNVMGDIQAVSTLQVRPGDNLTLDWHHDYRNDSDEVIAFSHHGPSIVYLSPDPPEEGSFVKIWEEGKIAQGVGFAPGVWSTTGDVREKKGRMDVRVPAGLKAGFYLLRAEMIGLHEADASYALNPRRGAQFYPNCVQLEVLGNGTVSLPEGVSFPGAYSYEDPGVVYNIYCSTETKSHTAPCTTTYQIPGPTVWSGAWPQAQTTEVPLGPVSNPTTATPWETWIASSVVTSGVFGDGGKITVVGSSTYEASWSSTYQTPAPGTRRW